MVVDSYFVLILTQYCTRNRSACLTARRSVYVYLLLTEKQQNPVLVE